MRERNKILTEEELEKILYIGSLIILLQLLVYTVLFSNKPRTTTKLITVVDLKFFPKFDLTHIKDLSGEILVVEGIHDYIEIGRRYYITYHKAGSPTGYKSNIHPINRVASIVEVPQ